MTYTVSFCCAHLQPSEILVMDFETFHVKELFMQPTDPMEVGEEQRPRA